MDGPEKMTIGINIVSQSNFYTNTYHNLEVHNKAIKGVLPFGHYFGHVRKHKSTPDFGP